MNELDLKHIGRFRQVGIYLGKFFRMFIYQSDWKVLPMAAIIAGLVALVTASGTFVTMEGTKTGTFAITCVCIWNGFFNSIQSIVRERPIIKREHRAGLHITSYVAAHMVYQLFLCTLQCLIMMLVYYLSNMVFPAEGLLGLPSQVVIFITLLLITYSADMMALMVSAIVRTTTTAMTVMPFLLILQLVFSGGFFSLPESVSGLSNLMVSKWGMAGLCIAGNYNSLPSVLIWNKLVGMSSGVMLPGDISMTQVLAAIQKTGGRDVFINWISESNMEAQYAFSNAGLLEAWGIMALFAVTFAFIAVVFLEFIDKDKR